MRYSWLKYLLAFSAGFLLVFVPYAITSAHLLAEETANGLQTMGPGLTFFVGLILAPFGGLAAVVLTFVIKRVYGSKSDPLDESPHSSGDSQNLK
jgi:hypothetical protein